MTTNENNLRGVYLVKNFTMRSAKKLDICLRMLYSEDISFTVNIRENEKQKIMYNVSVDVDEQTFTKLKTRLETLSS